MNTPDLPALLKRIHAKIWKVDVERAAEKKRLFDSITKKTPGMTAEMIPTPKHDAVRDALAYVYDAVNETITPPAEPAPVQVKKKKKR